LKWCHVCEVTLYGLKRQREKVSPEEEEENESIWNISQNN